MLPLFSAVFHPILFILAGSEEFGSLAEFVGNYDMLGSLEEFKIQPDWTTDCGVSCL